MNEAERTQAVVESGRLESNFEKNEEKKASTKKRLRDLFDVREVTEGARRVRVTEVPELGVTVRWCKLSFTEYAGLNDVKDVQDRSYRAVARMIHKANPDRGEDEILRMLREDLALDEFALINARMGREMASFLPVQKT